MATYILITGFILSILTRSILVINGKHIADVWHLWKMGEVTLAGLNPYLYLDFNVYPPGALILEVFSILIENLTNLEFHLSIKLWPNLADLVSALLIYKYLIKTKTAPLKASLWSTFFLLNPVSIIISAAHGQLDAVVSLLVLLAVVFLTNSKRYLSALVFGLAVSIKPNPLVLLPAFLLNSNLFLLQKRNFLFLALAPLSLSLLPYLLEDPPIVLSRLLTYSGVYDFFYAAILKGIWYQINAQVNLPTQITAGLLSVSKYTFFAGMLFLLLLFSKGKDLIKLCLATYLLFFVFYFGNSAQYLIWVLPFAVLSKDKMVILYTFFATLALVGFYLFFGPDILLGKLPSPMPFQREFIYPYFLGNLGLWIVCFVWFIKTVSSQLREDFSKFSLLHKKLLIFSIAIFLLSLIPIIFQLVDFYQLYYQQLNNL